MKRKSAAQKFKPIKILSLRELMRKIPPEEMMKHIIGERCDRIFPIIPAGPLKIGMSTAFYPARIPILHGVIIPNPDPEPDIKLEQLVKITYTRRKISFINPLTQEEVK